MKKNLIASILGVALCAPAISHAEAGAAAAPASPHSFTGNFTLASEYLYRGIAQTRGKPALQGGVDYAHSSGLYAGVWGSNISWINDGIPGASASLELDVYGGYKGSLSGDLGYDVGVLTYNYPGSGKTLAAWQELKQDTTEIYGAVNWKWLSVKYSHSTSALFGWAKKTPGQAFTLANLSEKTKGSGYLELNATYDLGNGWNLIGHAGHQKVKGNSDASYSDVKVGVTKDLPFGTLGLAYWTTNAKDNCNGNAAATASDMYCFVNNNGSNAYSAGKSRALLSFTKTF